LCAAIGRRKYGGKKMAAMAKKGRRNPPTTSFIGVVELPDKNILKSSRYTRKADAMKWARKVYKSDPLAKRAAVIEVKKRPEV
jgi:hypothetical protein